MLYTKPSPPSQYELPPPYSEDQMGKMIRKGKRVSHLAEQILKLL